jgi:hypothetical protein
MIMNEIAINIIDGLKGQHAQLRRLLAQRMWIRLAPPNTATANICYRRKFRLFGSRWLPQTTSVG